ncbi:MAG TPA: hypothetical protein VFS97_00805 [Nitrososphaeraceae archaeon]|nr:hypothetical protein [Nitrososphaeraceae archaeon]
MYDVCLALGDGSISPPDTTLTKSMLALECIYSVKARAIVIATTKDLN